MVKSQVLYDKKMLAKLTGNIITQNSEIMSYDNNENRGESIFEDSPRTLISNEK